MKAGAESPISSSFLGTVLTGGNGWFGTNAKFYSLNRCSPIPNYANGTYIVGAEEMGGNAGGFSLTRSSAVSKIRNISITLLTS